MKNTYYWRAIRRIAARKGISITKARRLDWEKEANDERKRRSKAHSKVRATKPKPREPVVLTRVSSRIDRKPAKSKRKDKIPTRVHKPELKLKKYERIPTRKAGTAYEELFDDSETEGDEDFQAEWETEWENDFPELDALDDLEDFLDSVEYEDSDKYKEPS